MCSLLRGRSTSIDDPHSTGTLSIGNYNAPLRRRQAYAQKPLFAFRVIRIRNGHFERVAEHRHGFREVNPVLLGICCRLLGIPLEFHGLSLHPSNSVRVRRAVAKTLNISHPKRFILVGGFDECFAFPDGLCKEGLSIQSRIKFECNALSI